jgi:hypothetical protein
MFGQRVIRRSIWNSVKSIWQETFPPEIDAAKIIKERQEKVKLQKSILEKEYTPEELEAFEKEIPDWKKNQLVFVKKLDEPDHYKKKSKPFIRNYLRQKYKDNKDLMELMDEVEGIKDSTKVFKENIQQQVLYSDNIVVKFSNKALEIAKDKLSADAMAEMLKRDPEFRQDLFEREIQFIFETTYHEFLNHNVKYLEKVCAGEAFAHFKSIIAEHNAKFGVPKYKDIVSISIPVLQNSFVLENKTPVFCFSVNFQEIYCLIDPNKPDTVLDGDAYKMVSYDYLIYVAPNPDPDIETIGHSWLIFKADQQNRMKHLI